MCKSGRRFHLAGLAVLLICLIVTANCSAGERPAKNVILMVADGAGFNSFRAASYYQHGRLGGQVYDKFPIRLACTTWSLDGEDLQQKYDPARAWSSFNALSSEEDGGSGYTDSAAAATAMCAGAKTTNGRICTDQEDLDLRNIAQIARGQGMRAGAVTTVTFSHATPACMGATNTSRGNYAEIANEMIFSDLLDVIIGCGHPDYDQNGKPLTADAEREYKFVGGKDTWEALRQGKTGEGWTLVTDLKQFEEIAADPSAAPAKLIGVVRVKETLQERRSGKEAGGLNTGVATLATMSLAAINTLASGEDGFVLMIEEQIDFNLAIEAVVKWIQANGGWGRTLLIITADHETGQLWGPGSGLPATFNPLVNNGKGNLPGAEYYSGGHTNSLVPLFAKGPKSEMFTKLIDGEDPRYGRYVDNTDVFKVMQAAITTTKIAPKQPEAVGANINP